MAQSYTNGMVQKIPDNAAEKVGEKTKENRRNELNVTNATNESKACHSRL
jgi:hypothetical protein